MQKASGPGKNTDWDMLNETLYMIDWDNLLDYNGPETAWANFKKVLFDKIDDHIPKFTIKTEYQPPWFDSECYTGLSVTLVLTKVLKVQLQNPVVHY